MWPHDVLSCAHSFSDAGGRPNSSTTSADLQNPLPLSLLFNGTGKTVQFEDARDFTPRKKPVLLKAAWQAALVQLG